MVGGTMEKVTNEEVKQSNNEERFNKVLSIIHYSTPPSTQHIYQYVAFARGKMNKFMTPKAKKWKKEFIETIKAQLPDNWEMWGKEKELKVFVEFVFPTRHKHDVDNYSKLIFDSMNELVYDDDSQIISCTVSKSYEKNEPRTWIDICEKWRKQ